MSVAKLSAPFRLRQLGCIATWVTLFGAPPTLMFWIELNGYAVMQWIAVTTRSGATSVPPQL